MRLKEIEAIADSITDLTIADTKATLGQKGRTLGGEAEIALRAGLHEIVTQSLGSAFGVEVKFPKTPSWVISVGSVHNFTCTRCGETIRFESPIPVNSLMAMIASFGVMHVNCKDPSA